MTTTLTNYIQYLLSQSVTSHSPDVVVVVIEGIVIGPILLVASPSSPTFDLYPAEIGEDGSGSSGTGELCRGLDGDGPVEPLGDISVPRVSRQYCPTTGSILQRPRGDGFAMLICNKCCLCSVAHNFVGTSAHCYHT